LDIVELFIGVYICCVVGVAGNVLLEDGELDRELNDGHGIAEILELKWIGDCNETTA
jgi:hypothetical protein